MSSNGTGQLYIGSFPKIDETLNLYTSHFFGLLCLCGPLNYHELLSFLGFLRLPRCQFNSVAQSCLTLCDPMDCSTPSLPGHPTISSSVIPFSSCPQSSPASGSFPMSQFFTSGAQNVGVSASTSVLAMSIQDWCLLMNVSMALLSSFFVY